MLGALAPITARDHPFSDRATFTDRLLLGRQNILNLLHFSNFVVRYNPRERWFGEAYIGHRIHGAWLPSSRVELV